MLNRSAPGPERTVAYGPHPDQVVDLWPGGAPGRPMVVLVHGGFWRPAFDRTYTRCAAAALHATGWPVASVEYRRTPGDPEPTVSDAADGLRAAAAEAGDAGIVAVGHSAGGHLVLLAAATMPGTVLGTVAVAPVADVGLAERLNLGAGAVGEYLGAPADEFPHLDPARVATPSGPVTIVHGDRDERVPVEISASYVRQRPGPRLVTLPGADHFVPMDPWTDAWTEVVARIRDVASER